MRMSIPLRRALAIQGKMDGRRYRHRVFVARSGDFFEDQSRYTDAEPLYRRPLAIREEVVVPNHFEVAPALNEPGGLLVNSDGSADAHEQAGSLPSRFANDGSMP
jgi:hypothetical protein